MGKNRRRGKKTSDMARPWWASPGVAVFAVALLMAAAGLALMIQAQRQAPVLAATVGDFSVRLQRARWMTDHMDHGGGFARPATMMPGMPEPGVQRLSVELALHNAGSEPVEYLGEEFSLVSSLGESYAVFGADVGIARLARGQRLNTALYFDVDTLTDPGLLRLRWQRGDRRVTMPLPPPPEHYHAQPRGDVVWPDAVTFLLPIGNFERGETLYAATFGCIACHGDVSRPASNPVGPHLGRIGTVASERVAGQPATQYIYESILRPNDYITAECHPGMPCSTPSAMPDYAELLGLQDMADLVTYLARQIDTG